MPRKINDLMEKSWPQAGWITAVCIYAEEWDSPKKHTPAIRLTWRDESGQYKWDDLIFLTSKALCRVALVASRVCGWDSSRELSDNDADAVQVLSDFIMSSVIGKKVDVKIEEQSQTFIHEAGPDIGRKGVRTIKRVAFEGYRTIPIAEGSKPPDANEKMPTIPEMIDEDKDVLPF